MQSSEEFLTDTQANELVGQTLINDMKRACAGQMPVARTSTNDDMKDLMKCYEKYIFATNYVGNILGSLKGESM